MNEEWKNLRVGDRIRIVRLPTTDGRRLMTLHRETRQLYRRLMSRKRPLVIYEVDKDGLPWIKCQFLRKTGGWEYHYLAVNDDSWVRVKARR